VGIVLNGDVYRGPHMAAGEFGEMVVADSPGGGSPGRPGCLEALAANPALCDRYAEFSDSPRRLRSGDTSGRVRTICHLAMQGEPAAREAIASISRYLGIGIANLVWGFNPDVIIIDGAITDAWPLVLAGVMEQLPGRELPNFRNLIIRSCGLGADAPLTGALLLPFGPLFATGERAVTSTLVRPPDQ
jgi:predicted NBD/HSP70 family sugar kinase